MQKNTSIKSYLKKQIPRHKFSHRSPAAMIRLLGSSVSQATSDLGFCGLSIQFCQQKNVSYPSLVGKGPEKLELKRRWIPWIVVSDTWSSILSKNFIEWKFRIEVVSAISKITWNNYSSASLWAVSHYCLRKIMSPWNKDSVVRAE